MNNRGCKSTDTYLIKNWKNTHYWANIQKVLILYHLISIKSNNLSFLAQYSIVPIALWKTKPRAWNLKGWILTIKLSMTLNCCLSCLYFFGAFRTNANIEIVYEVHLKGPTKIIILNTRKTRNITIFILFNF